ncbi:MAG: exodeoxyribonuclease III [Thermoplasmatales archaeon]|nr:exodeoxyribonuclease III [Thermoplasmatales archaeon]MCW6170753.1 exodeoxyribonuclease III [Thermoplasmatales archaeon]
MKYSLISWNVNGLRSAVKNGLISNLNHFDADAICLQEIKTDPLSVPKELDGLGYKIYVNSAEKKGYSGTLCLLRIDPTSVATGIENPKFDNEGRIQVIEFKEFWLLNSYFPNSQRGLTRLDYKLEFNQEFLNFVQKLRKTKPVVICGDMNVAHEDIDIARPKDNRHNAGFTDEERNWMTDFLKKGYVDTFRLFNNDGGNYTWWSYMFNAREKNIGWRIDYFIVSKELQTNVIESKILRDVKGSDHAPIELKLSFSK